MANILMAKRPAAEELAGALYDAQAALERAEQTFDEHPSDDTARAVLWAKQTIDLLNVRLRFAKERVIAERVAARADRAPWLPSTPAEFETVRRQLRTLLRKHGHVDLQRVGRFGARHIEAVTSDAPLTGELRALISDAAVKLQDAGIAIGGVQ